MESYCTYGLVLQLIVTRDESRVSYQIPVPYKDLPSSLHLAGNLSKLLDIDVRVESTESVSDTLSNITLFAFVDESNMMSKSDLLRWVKADSADW